MRATIKKYEEGFFKMLMIASALIIMGVLIFIIGTIVYKGLPSLNWDMISKLPGGGFYLGKEGGVLNAIIGSLYIVAGSLMLSIFLSVPVVMYINFYLPKNSLFANITRFCFDILFGVPSIVYGAFGFALMIYLGIRASLLGGIITVAMLIMPIMMRSLDEVTRLLSRDLPDALLSLGATKYEMTKVILRQLMPGVITAVLLAVGRGIGDVGTGQQQQPLRRSLGCRRGRFRTVQQLSAATQVLGLDPIGQEAEVADAFEALW